VLDSTDLNERREVPAAFGCVINSGVYVANTGNLMIEAAMNL